MDTTLEQRLAELEEQVAQLQAEKQALVDSLETTALQHVEELTAQLTAERERFQISQQAAGIGTFEWLIPQGKIVWTPELEALYGLAPGSFEGNYEGWTRRVYAPDLSIAETSIQEALRGVSTYRAEFRVIWPDGSLHWVEGSGKAYFDEVGQPLRLIGMNVDIGKRKETELSLRRSEDRLTQFFRSNVVGLVFTENGYIKDANDAFLNMLGYSRQDIETTPMTGSAITPPEYVLVDQERLKQALQTGYSTPYEKEFVHKDGHRVPTLVGYSFVNSFQREAVLIAVDLTQSKKIERQQQLMAEAGKTLSASLDLSETLQSLAQLIVPNLADICGISLLEDNGTELRSYGLARRDSQKQAEAQLLSQQYPTSLETSNGASEVVRSGQSQLWPEITDEMIKASSQDSEYIELMLSFHFKSIMIVPLKARDHTFGTLSLITTTDESNRRYDATDLTFAEELAQRAALAVDNARLYAQAQKSLETRQELDHLKDLFMSVASHELRTPLTSIRGYSQLLQRGLSRIIRSNNDQTIWEVEQPKLSRSLDTILYQTERMGDLVNQLLDFSRIQNRQLVLQLTEGENLAELVRQVVEQQRLTVGENRLKLNLPPQPLRARYDKARVEQVLDNLINNAFKYSPSDSSVGVIVEQRPDALVVAVRDQGIGISEADQLHIFEQFYRSQSREAIRVEGLGLGLFVSHEIIAQHGGQMWLESQPGQGSTFYFSLPL